MEKTYNPQAIEQHWYRIWEEAGYFKPSGNGTPYCIMLPPPNVTGSLHMGHGFQVSLMDTLIRYQRMCGKNVLWQGGTDHAGIATQMVVERQLEQEGKSRQQLGREAFVERIWQWKAQSGGTITQQLRRIGASIDWSRECFTMDDTLDRAVTKVFVSLYEEGLIYRGKRLVNWDPKFRTAISDLEVTTTEEKGQLFYIRYPLATFSQSTGRREYITVATSRPETLFGDVAVAVHPEDPRYQHLIGQKVKLPLTGREIPIIADEAIETEFGTGCVKITPAHDFNDYAMAQRHNLPMINILTIDAHLNNDVPTDYQGLDRYVARKKAVAALQQLELIEKIEDYTIKIPRGDRSGEVIEPYLTDQWFVKVQPLAEKAIEVVTSGQTRFVPERWDKTYFQWMENIEDWCISRQLWWGHRIPAWQDTQGNTYVGDNETAVRAKYQLGTEITLTQDADVLDTWFSSALWPFSTLGWPEHTTEFNTFYPTSVLVTGFDIIFFWVARMIMMGCKFADDVPFKDVYVTGLIRDNNGQKMSKSKGNVLDPIDLVDGIDLDSLVKKRTSGLLNPKMAKQIENNTRKEFPKGIAAFGTDALRFTFCALASTGRDIRFDLGRLEGYRNFCNKLWNAARYVLMNVENRDTGLNVHDAIEYSLADHWIQARLQATIATAIQHLNEYRFDLLAQSLYEFVWNEYCDWYLELAKPILTNPDSSAALQRGTRQTLVQVLETLLRLLHPLMPFITEEIWQLIAPLAGKQGPSLMLQTYPQVDTTYQHDNAIADITWLQQLIIAVRTLRAEMNISPAKTIPLLINKASAADKLRLQQMLHYLLSLAKIDTVTWLTPENPKQACATALAGGIELLIPMADFIDTKAELQRLDKELAKLKEEHDRCQTRLDNTNYVNRAPAEVVAKEQARLVELNDAIEKLTTKRSILQQT